MSFELTLDKPTKVWLKKFYTETSHTILEYGSGGSTFLALDSNPDTTVHCCETDPEWLKRVAKEVKKKGYDDRFTGYHLDIGKTGAWGRPVGPSDPIRLQKFVKCAITPWIELRKKNIDPTVIFIDGRFRTACFLTALLYIRQPATIIWDDYGDRPYYHIFDDLIQVKEMVGRTAIFEVEPKHYDMVETFNKYLHIYGDWR